MSNQSKTAWYRPESTGTLGETRRHSKSRDKEKRDMRMTITTNQKLQRSIEKSAEKIQNSLNQVNQ